MPHSSRSQIPPPVDITKEPDIANALLTPLIVIPEEGTFKGYLTEQDLKDLQKRDQKTVLALSVMEQWGVWQTEQMVLQNYYIRQNEAEIIRLKTKVRILEEQAKEVGWKISFVKWASLTVIAGLMSALFRWIFDRVGK